MVFAEQLQRIGSKADQQKYEDVRVMLVTEWGVERFRTAIAEEYLLFREECLKATQRGEWRCTMRIERDRYGSPKRVGEILVDSSFSEEVKWTCANLTTAMLDHFTGPEAEMVQAEFERRLREDGFSCVMVTVTEDINRFYEACPFRVDVSAAWWRIVQ